MRRRGKIIQTFHPGVHLAGTFNKHIKAPAKTGIYHVIVFAKTACGQSKRDKTLTVK